MSHFENIKEDIMGRQKHNWVINLFLVFLFAFFVVFFTNIHPIVLSDIDDWWYTCYFRDAVPLWGAWNPARVFAEVFMPLISKIGMFGLAPILGRENVFDALTICYAVVVSIAIVMVFKLISLWLGKKNDNKRYLLLGCILIFINHFWIFRSAQTNNQYMLYTRDACTFFYYLIPNLLNVVLVLWMMMDDEIGEFTKGGAGKRSAWIVLLYFCIFSNAWASIITAAYVGYKLLESFIIFFQRKEIKFKTYIISQISRFVILLLWLIQQIFELSGGRAGMDQEAASFTQKLVLTLKHLWALIKTVNIPFIISFAIIVIGGIVLMLVKKKRDSFRIVGSLFAIMVIIGIYDIITCAAVDPSYIRRADVIYGLFIFAMLIEVVALYEIMTYVKMVEIFVPLLIILAIFNCDTKGKTYLDSTIYQLKPSVVNEINMDILNQLIEADEKGLSEIELLIPKFKTSDNWPYTTYAGNRFASFAYEYGYTKKQITVKKVIPSQEKREQYLL